MARILVVEDDASVRDLVVTVVRLGQHTVDSACNGRDALGCLEDRSYDLILCDLKMPELDGAGLYGTIQERWPETARRILFVSANVGMPEYEDFLRRGRLPFLQKPFSVERLQDAVRQMLSASKR